MHQESLVSAPSSRTSRMVAVTAPARWSYEVVDAWYGELRRRRDQSVAVQGDFLRHVDTMAIVELLGREGAEILVHPLTHGEPT